MKRLLLIILSISLLCAGCTSSPTAKRELFAMDTVMHLTAYTNSESVLNECETEIKRLETLLSVNSLSGDIANINNHTGEWVTVNTETASLLQTCIALSRETHGLFDITVYPAVKAWGFTEGKQAVPEKNVLQSLLPFIDYGSIQLKDNQVFLKKGMGLDLGGIAKGYTADRLKALYGDTSGVISLGGNVLTVGEKPDEALFTVAIQNPTDSNDTLGLLSVKGDTAVVTSGDYQRYFEENGKRYHHILDPRTAHPAQNDLTSVTVVTHSATRADALSTALFIMGLEKALTFVTNHPDIEAVFVTKENEVIYTNGLTFTPQNQQYHFSQSR